MKKIILSISIFFLFLLNLNAHVDHYEKINYLEYELLRNNQTIGYHKYRFLRNNDNLNVESEVSFKISKLGIQLY